MASIDHFRKLVKRELDRRPVLAWRQAIPTSWMEKLAKQHAPAARKRLWHLEIMIWYWLTAALHREESFNAVTTELWAPLCAYVPEIAQKQINPGRMAEGRARVPVELLRDLRQEWAGQGVREGSGCGLWKGRRTLWMDGSTASMSDEPHLHQHFGTWSNQHGPSPFPFARMVNLGIAGTRILIGSACGPSLVSELELALPLLEHLQKGDIMTADRYYASAELMELTLRKGGDIVTRMHPQLKIDHHPHRKIGHKDWIIQLPFQPDARRRHPDLPEFIEVRVFRTILGTGKNRQELWIETTLLDPLRYPKEEVAQLYWWRWGAETSYDEIKSELHLRILRSKTIDGVYREIEAHLAVYNYVRLQMLRAAKCAGLEPRTLSFTHTVRTLFRFGQIIQATSTSHERTRLHRIMQKQIAAGRLPSRPGRHEPRAVKRNPQPYTRLRCSRQAWRREHGYAA